LFILYYDYFSMMLDVLAASYGVESSSLDLLSAYTGGS
jgi:hypothetical protein